MKQLGAATLVVTLLTACAGASYRPLVDRPGANYEQDLAECQRYAEAEAGAQSTSNNQRDVIRNCLAGRGYSVLR